MSSQKLIQEDWNRQLFEREIPLPLVFVAGMHVPVRKGSYCGTHSHTAVEIVFHPKGSGVTRTSTHEIHYANGSAVIYAPGEAHDQTTQSDGEDLWFQVGLPRQCTGRFSAGFYVAQVEKWWVIEELQQLSRNRTQPDSQEQQILDLRATAVLLALVQTACTQSRHLDISVSQQYIEIAERYIQESFSTIHSLQDVADHVGISHDHLRHLFKCVKGISLIRYLNEVRLARARLLLSTSPLPLKQIATMCGFSDEYYFSAVFKKLTALSPGAYRSSHGSRRPPCS